MSEKDVRLSKAKAEQARARFTATLEELKHRLKPATLASDAWDGVKDKSSDIADKSVQVVKDRPVAVGGVLAAIAVFALRSPLSSLLGNMFGNGREDDGRVTTNLSKNDDEFDLTAPVVAEKEGAIA